jgi:hypothetical protein
MPLSAKNILVLATLSTLLYANPSEEDLAGFDDTPSTQVKESTKEVVQEEKLIKGLTGKFTEQVAFSLNNNAPHDDFSSFKSSLLLDYEHKFDNGIRIKVNAKAYYDAIYSFKGREDFSSQELDALESEIELFDAYVEGKITDNLDYKLGRQVVVWGRSDTIRVTDVLNPLDNRRPAMVDIEDLRLPIAMAKFDYFVGDWRITPMAIFEQRFSKNPPFGSVFNPSALAPPSDESYDDVTYALSVSGEFSGWDISFYGAHIYNDAGKVRLPTATEPKALIEHEKISMFGTAVNILSGSWLFKSELAYFDGLEYFTTGDKQFTRTDILFGVEYNGIANTIFSYDIVSRNIGDYDARLINETIAVKEHEYQHAFRVSSDFMNATLTANYLVSLYGEKLDEGGFQRAWVKYALADAININVGVIDYIGGSTLFDKIEDNDMVFMDISYSF